MSGTFATAAEVFVALHFAVGSTPVVLAVLKGSLSLFEHRWSHQQQHSALLLGQTGVWIRTEQQAGLTHAASHSLPIQAPFLSSCSN